jgi:RNA polymerase sigma-70 factor, ECF subfamily
MVNASVDPEPTQTPRCDLPTIEDIYARCHQPVHRILRSRGLDKDESADLSQTVWLIVLERLHTCRNRQEPWAWVATIALNVRRKYRVRRRQERQAMLDHETNLTAVATPLGMEAEEAEKQEDAQLALLVKLLDQVPNQQRQDVLRLHYLAGLSPAEIAKELERPVRTVRWQLEKGEEELKAALRRHVTRERHAAQAERRAAVVPIFGALDMLRALGKMEVPKGTPASIWEHLADLPARGVEGGGPAAPALPPGAPDAPRSQSPVFSWSRGLLVSAWVVVVVASAILVAVYSDPGPRSARVPVELGPDVAAVIASSSAPAPSAASRPDAAPSSGPAPSAPIVSVRRAASAEHAPSEHEVLDRAQRALLSHDPVTALAAVADHTRLFPGGGLLTAWRESLRIAALAEARSPCKSLTAAPFGAQVGAAP